LVKDSGAGLDADNQPRPATSDAEPQGNAPQSRERRSKHRVGDDQQTGQGSLTALSKMKMLQRKREAIRPAREEPLKIFD
jgi:hypothetical protein